MTIARIAVVAAVIAFAVPPPTRAADPATQPATRPADFDALAAQLASPDGKARNEAQAKIVKLGDAVAKAVEALAATTDDPEVRVRAEAIVRQISSAALTEPTLVTLKFADVPAKDVYDALIRQSKGQLSTSPNLYFDEGNDAKPARRVTVDLANVPFWKALAELESQTGVHVRFDGSRMMLIDVAPAGFARVAGNVPVAVAGGAWRDAFVSGPFMAVPDSTPPQADTIRQLRVFVEPRLRVIGYRSEAVIEELLDAQGEPVQPKPHELQRAAAAAARAQAFAGRPGAGTRYVDFGGNAFIARLPAPAPRDGWVRGSVRALVAAEEQVIEINDVTKANNVERIEQGRRVRANVMDLDPGEWIATVVVYGDNSEPVITGTGMNRARIEFLDANGDVIPSNARGSYRGGNTNRAVYNMEFKLQQPNGPPPAKLRIRFHTKTREIDIPFEFGRKPNDAAAQPVEVELE